MLLISISKCFYLVNLKYYHWNFNKIWKLKKSKMAATSDVIYVPKVAMETD